MRVPFPSPALFLGVAVGAALAVLWPDPQAEAEQRVAELEGRLEHAQARNTLRTALQPLGPADPVAYPADPVLWQPPWRPPPGDHPEHDPEVLHALLFELAGDPDAVLGFSCEPYPCRAVVIAEPGLFAALEQRGYHPYGAERTERFQLPKRSWDLVTLSYADVLLPVEIPDDEGFGKQLLAALRDLERPGLEAVGEQRLNEAWAARLDAAGEPLPPELAAALP